MALRPKAMPTARMGVGMGSGRDIELNAVSFCTTIIGLLFNYSTFFFPFRNFRACKACHYQMVLELLLIVLGMDEESHRSVKLSKSKGCKERIGNNL